ncbi:hypothetical protein CRENBAI_019187 [Crenichthys baileyi]|uniref:CARD domain-containing protein n=1 Tax=Crenichthys baileyi TaxID=28760 RepID=A0AAV9REU7_9TELE
MDHCEDTEKKTQRKAQSNKQTSTKPSAEPVPSKEPSNRSSTCPTWCCPFQRTEVHEPEHVQPLGPVPGPQSESKTEAKPANKGSFLRSIRTQFPVSMACVVKRISTEYPEEFWDLVCPPGDKDAESKLWLKTSLENLNNQELKYFHWFLRTGNQTKYGFKPIRKSRLQHADRLDTIDLMFQMYPKDFKKEVLSWVVNNLDHVDDRDLKYFHWFLKTADKSKDGFKPIKNSDLEDADRLDTAHLMVQTYTTNSKEVTQMILNKIKRNKGKVIPEAEEQMKPSSPAAAEEKELSKVLDHFVQKAPKETLARLSQALVADGVLKETILEKNHTRMNRASCLADTVMDKGPDAFKKMIHHLQVIDVSLSTKLGLFSGPFAPQGHSLQEPQSKQESERGSVCKPAIQQLLTTINSAFQSSALRSALNSWKSGISSARSGMLSLSHVSVKQRTADLRRPVEEQEESWSQICPEGDNDADLKQWLKDSLEDLNSKELKYFHWFLHTADKSKDGFKPIKKSRLEHADRLDTVDLMFQVYTTNSRGVAEKIFKKINKNKGQNFSYWLLDTLEDLDDRELKYFHWFLHTADKSKDGFKPIKKSKLENADRLDTVDLMVQMYATNTKEVTEKIVEKIRNNKDKVTPEEQKTLSSPTAAQEKLLTRMLNDFVEKVPKDTFTQLMEALISANTLKASEKEKILQNHTRVNMASCFIDIVMEKGTDASKVVITSLQTIDPELSSELSSPSSPGHKSHKDRSAGKKSKRMSKEQEECWRQICPLGDKDADLKRWLKKTLEELKTKELRYFQWYLRTADESKDGFKPIKRFRLTHADRLDTLDLLVNLYPAKTKEVTEKVLEKISSNTAQHLVLEAFDEMGDEDLKYCQMILQSTDKFMGSITPTRKAPTEDGEEVDAVNLMMQMYNLENREELQKALNKIQERTEDLSEAGDEDNPPSPAALGEKKMKNMLLDFIKKVSSETLEQLLKDLVADKVLTASEGKSVVEQNHTRVNKASCLVEILKEKGSETCQKVSPYILEIISCCPDWLLVRTQKYVSSSSYLDLHRHGIIISHPISPLVECPVLMSLTTKLDETPWIFSPHKDKSPKLTKNRPAVKSLHETRDGGCDQIQGLHPSKDLVYVDWDRPVVRLGLSEIDLEFRVRIQLFRQLDDPENNLEW